MLIYSHLLPPLLNLSFNMSLNTKFKLLFSKMSPAEKKVVEYTSADVAWGPTTE